MPQILAKLNSAQQYPQQHYYCENESMLRVLQIGLQWAGILAGRHD